MSFVKLFYEFCGFKGSYLFSNRENQVPTVFISYYQIFQGLFTLHIEYSKFTLGLSIDISKNLFTLYMNEYVYNRIMNYAILAKNVTKLTLKYLIITNKHS